MPGPASESHRGPRDEGPYVPAWLFRAGPKLCPCGHHEGYHNDAGACLQADRCRCERLPADRRTSSEAMMGLNVAADQLKSIVERIERLEGEKKTIADDIKDVYAEAKGNGYDVKALKSVIRLRKLDIDERAEQETILETYMRALGML